MVEKLHSTDPLNLTVNTGVGSNTNRVFLKMKFDACFLNMGAGFFYAYSPDLRQGLPRAGTLRVISLLARLTFLLRKKQKNSFIKLYAKLRTALTCVRDWKGVSPVVALAVTAGWSGSGTLQSPVAVHLPDAMKLQEKK